MLKNHRYGKKNIITNYVKILMLPINYNQIKLIVILRINYKIINSYLIND